MANYRKAIAAVIGAVLITLESVGVDFKADAVDLVPSLTAIVMAILVYAVPNRPA